ncbi:MAG: hypothetical protein H0S85_03090 [Desulfovibrionaceae bacterium]|jgi:hypothetical protein|nr:hypothetical protein [Desulfovibrionaceae bacterium]
MKRLLMPLVLAAVAALAGSALDAPNARAEDNPALQCGRDIPVGDYRKECDTPKWESLSTFTAICTVTHVNRERNAVSTSIVLPTLSCAEVKACDFRLALFKEHLVCQ